MWQDTRVKEDPNTRLNRTFQLGPSIASVTASAERFQRWVRLARATIALGIIMGIGTWGFWELTERHHTIIEALYMTVISISTMGFTEVIPIETDVLRIFTMGLILLGGAAVVYFLATVASFIVEGDIFFGFVRRRLESRLRRIEGHVIVAGLGRVGGHTFAEIFASRVPVVGIDSDNERLEALVARHGERVLFAAGEAFDEAVLRAVGIDRAATLITALSDDRDNFLLAVTARQINPEINLLIRLIDPDNADMFDELHVKAIVHPPTSTGRRVANTLVHAQMVEFVEQLIAPDSHRLKIIKIVGDVRLAGRSVADFRDAPNTPRVLGLAHGNDEAAIFRPPADEVVRADDTLFLLGRRRALTRFRKRPPAPVDPSEPHLIRDEAFEHRVIVAGAGDLGRSVAFALQREGALVTIIDLDADMLARCEKGAANVTAIHGDAFSRVVLGEAGIQEATALVVALPSLRDNLFLSAIAKRLRPSIKLIARVGGPTEATRLRAVGALVINQGQIGGVHLARLAIYPGLAAFAEGLEASIDGVELLRSFRVDEACGLDRHTLAEAELQAKTGCVIIGTRKKETAPFQFQPPSKTRLRLGHELLALGTVEQLALLSDVFHPTPERAEELT